MSSANKYTLKPSLSEKFKGIIWKVEIDDTFTTVALETRVAEAHQTYFSAFDFSSGECLFREISVEDSWNWGLNYVNRNHLLLHSYVTEKSPEHKGIIAIDTTGTIKWQHFNKAVQFVSEKGLLVYNPSLEPRRPELISTESGSVLNSSGVFLEPLTRNIYLPDLLAEDLVKDNPRCPEAVGPVSHIFYNDKEVYSFHVRSGKFYSQKLLIYQDNTVILDEILEENIQKLNPEAFFIGHNHLFCIRKGKQEFVSYLL